MRHVRSPICGQTAIWLRHGHEAAATEVAQQQQDLLSAINQAQQQNAAVATQIEDLKQQRRQAVTQLEQALDASERQLFQKQTDRLDTMLNDLLTARQAQRDV